MSAIFISHSSADNEAATELIERLEEQGHHSVFLDFDPEQGIPAGTNWEQVLYAKLRACRAVIVLCSKDSMASYWCFAEITHARSLGKDLFPVKFGPCNLQSVLSDTQAIDLSVESNYQQLWRGLKEAGLEDIFEWDGIRDPYPGLSAFQEQDAALFFGRTDDIHKGIDLLRSKRRSGAERLILYLGASGSGKSSLMRAGLIPRLKKDQDNWVVIDPFRPNAQLGDAFMNLASELSASFKRYDLIREKKISTSSY